MKKFNEDFENISEYSMIFQWKVDYIAISQIDFDVALKSLSPPSFWKTKKKFVKVIEEHVSARINFNHRLENEVKCFLFLFFKFF